jgi:3-phosphoshikimate 1-carboxyvinyltransferase
VPLPDLLEIVPLEKSVQAEIVVPGSKSITNRALILAALAHGETTLQGALWSEDTQVMVECLQELGFMVNVQPDRNEVCNRTITIYGKGGAVPRGGTLEQPLELFVANAGTAARFLAAFVCLGQGVYRVSGVERMHERPQAELFAALRQLGYRVESQQKNERLPATISVETTSRQAARSCTVSIERSSQFASALLLCARTGGWQVSIQDNNPEESPYVHMTSELVKVFPKSGGAFVIEPDASSGSYFLAAGLLNPKSKPHKTQGSTGLVDSAAIRVANWPRSGWQIDQHFGTTLGPGFLHGLELWRESGRHSEARSLERPDPPISRARDLGDSIMTAIVLAPFSLAAVQFTDLGRLRLQECERVTALRTELTRCGAKVIEQDNTLTVYPSLLHGALIETYDDHRMAMCFAILGLKIPGIQIKNPGCVKKTFPNFFQKLAMPAPNGLGVELRDPHSRRRFGAEELLPQ